MYQQQNIETLLQTAKRRLDLQEAPGSTKAGWLMITALLIESWDIYSMAFILFALKDIYEPSSWLLGFTAAGTQMGAVIGALLGGWLTDKVGRRKIFLGSMIAFAICAILQGIAPNMYWLAIIRCFAGIPVGADVANGFTYIMEVMPKGKREVMANRWQFMFAIGIIAAIILVTSLIAIGVHNDYIWRIVLAFPAIPAFILLLLRRELPETPAWFVERGRFIEAKKAAKEYYGEQDGRLLDDILPDENIKLESPTVKEALHDLFSQRFSRRTTVFGWISCAVQSFENYAFSFYLPLILATIGISGQIQNNLALLFVNCIAAISALVGPLLLPKLGHRGLSQYGFLFVVIGILIAAYGVYTLNYLLITSGAALMLWGHYWDSESGMTVISLVAKPKYRGVASGIGYTIVKITAFVTTLVFPPLFEVLGVPIASAIIAIAPFFAFLAATFLLPEVFGHAAGDNQEHVQVTK
ncbi:MFS transporter [Brenneria corticis]|uniref:MFS transporter n=1 Tax=Brenneria corticis TaxID=2173106 RepID=A0A2U1UBF2_9GAMM|nr:MFS transporter [Brenneria sp. CFCC 11842]PWC18999.1 MFS transporter [Brenneria sp. CFCC 11842]